MDDGSRGPYRGTDQGCVSAMTPDLRRRLSSILFAWNAGTLWRAFSWREIAGEHYRFVEALGPFEEPS